MKDQSRQWWDELLWRATGWWNTDRAFAPVLFCMCMLNVSRLFKADDESLSNLPMEALLHSEEASSSCRWWWFTGLRLISQTHFTCHYPRAGTNSWFCGVETAGMPNSVLKSPWLMSLQAVKSYFLKIFRWSFSIQPKMVLLPRLLRVTTAEKWLKNSQESMIVVFKPPLT